MKKISKLLIILFSTLVMSGFVSSYFEITKNLEIFNNVYREINSYYVDPVDPGELMHSTIDTMLKRLDPYTQYIPESEIEDFRFQTTGDYGGVGATIRKVDQFVVIYEPYKNFPADKAGLKMGDILLEIDGKKIIDYSTENVSELLKGTPGTNVEVKIKRWHNNSYDMREHTITREKIHVPSVPYSGIISGDIGYVKLKRFTKNCTQEVETALDNIANEMFEDNGQDVPLSGLILDLRSNPGGLLNESINLSNLFIDKNEIVVTTNGKNVEWEKIYKTKKAPQYKDLPLVVLVNNASASASEIVAGAIQDLDRGVIIGNKTYGKGLVQQSRKLSYNARLKVTVAKYYTPSGRCIQNVKHTKGYNSYLMKESSNDKDSLNDNRNTFVTRGGRTVYDGGGIDPDIKIDPIEYPEILIELVRKNHIFKFGNLINGDIPEYNSTQEFNLSDDHYNQFVNYLDTIGFEFASNHDDIINLIEVSLEEFDSEEFNLTGFHQNLDILKSNVDENKKNQLKTHKNIISERLEGNLITRLFYEQGRIENSLKDDIYVSEAIRVLKNKAEYKEILEP
tara:strand:+ start:1760 stop:3457 length:1698 start_codon:yes stop_codon:yes gene_type:complete